MNNVAEFTKCSNCGACYNICPVSAIRVKSDKLFYELVIDNDKCIDCGKCKNVCPVNNLEKKQTVISSYAGTSIDSDIVSNSSSGGAFYEFAQAVILQGGVVFSAVYSDDYKSVVFSNTDETPLENMMKSKYVESLVGDEFAKIKKQLEVGREVMFCGAPCQVAGLKNFLKKEYSNLLTCDFSCGGMPSHLMYEEYLNDIEAKLKSSVISVDFRPKIYGWNLHAIKVLTQNKKKYIKIYKEDPYFYCFLGNRYSVRDYCYNCDFADNHYSDIIIADFWKCDSISNISNDNSGISLLITNSPKGEEYINRIRKNFNLTILDNQKATYNLHRTTYSGEFFEKRAEFLESCSKHGFIKTTKKIKLPKTTKTKLKFYCKKYLNFLTK